MHFAKLALAAAVTLFLINSASASPLTTSKPVFSSSLIDVQHRRYDTPRHRHVTPRHRHSRRYVPGRRYSAPPRGWRRYGARPGNWQRRGCIMAGPVWFCP